MSSLFGLIIWYSLNILVGSIIVGLEDGIRETISLFIVMEVLAIGTIIVVFWMTGGFE